jgi:hypothetical protein
MADQKKGKKKGQGKKLSLIDRIKALITEDSDSATGTGGAQRSRSIDSAVDAMQSGIDDADKDAKGKK